MDETYIKMCKEAGEIQELWKPSDGDKIYTEYSEKDRKFAQEHWKSNKKGFSSYVTNFEFLNNPNGTYEPYLKENNIWILRQEDLQEIFQEAHGNGIHVSTVVNSFYRWFWDEYNNKQKDCCEQYDWNVLWLCFVMERLYGKYWNSKTESWEVIT